MLRQAVSQEAMHRAALVKKVKAAQANIDATTEQHKEESETLASVQSESSECEAVVRETERHLKKQRTLTAQSVKSFRVAHKQLVDLQKGPLATFKEIVQQSGAHITVDDVEAKQMEPAVIPAQLDAEMTQDAEEHEGDSCFFRAVSPLNLGLGLKIGTVYAEADLRRRCNGDESKLAILEECMNDTSKLAPAKSSDQIPTLHLDDEQSNQEPSELTGTPVIDRSQPQAILRRRSAALPMKFFSRLSLMSRRQSVAARQQKAEDDVEENNASNTDVGTDDADMAEKSQYAQDAETVRPTDVPTPSRSSLGATQ
jgi:hypothetical protein